MDNINNITLIGTSHIARESIKKVTSTINESKPDIVAVELDPQRYYALMHEKKKTRLSLYNIGRIGFKGFLFAVIGSWVSNKLGRMVGVEPGDEMKAAIKAAKKNKIKIALIDQDIELTLSRFSRYFTWKERWRFIGDIFTGMFFRKGEMKKYGLEKFDLSKVPPEVVIEKLMGVMKKRYPSLYRVLVDERNRVMADRLKTMLMQNPAVKIVAVVGAGHINGIRDILSRPGYEFSFEYSA